MDQAGFFRGRYKSVGSDPPPIRMRPTKQRFNTSRLSGLEGQLRLKMEPECVALKRLAELSQQHEVGRTVGFHMLRINQIIVARFSCGPPRHIRVTEKSVRVIALPG